MAGSAAAVQSTFDFIEQVEPAHKNTSTFTDNLSLPVHRWFRYSAGFSALWVRDLIEQEKAKGRCRVLDPFAGSGTVPLEAEVGGVEAIGIEAHPFVARVARTKLLWRENSRAFREYGLAVLDHARESVGETCEYPKLIHKCFPADVLMRLHSLRVAWENVRDGSPLSELAWLALVSVLRECSPVGTAQWQYVLPNKTKSKSVDPYRAFEAKVYLMCEDMQVRQREPLGPQARICMEDARTCASVDDGWADLVVTSPPYANNYDYADATRLEMSFLGEVKGWGDLQDVIRKYLMRSCTQHVARMGSGDELLTSAVLRPISRELGVVYERLASEKELHGGKKRYHIMLAAYFHDLANAWVALRRVTSKGALACFVIGDSAPYGIYAPVHRWLGELAVAAGFKSYTFEKIRDRNIKWKNRKHRVPLCEGRLWVNG